MTIREYEEQAAVTATYPEGSMYPYLGLIEEIGEVAGVLAKAERDNGGVIDDERHERLLKECGDVAWMLAAIARDMGRPLHDLHGPDFASEPEPYPPSVLTLVSTLADYAGGLAKWRQYNASDDREVLEAFEDWQTLCFALGFSPAEVARANIMKLRDRQARGVIHGEGDNR